MDQENAERSHTRADAPSPGTAPPPVNGETQCCHWRLCVAVVLAVYAAGLTHGLSRPWVGMHDWNGAFYSQLARNLLRYPLSAHGGLGVVAVGQALPPEEERSIYATHPPGLIWLVAAAFRLFGESEWSARLVVVLASLASLALLIHLVKQAYGLEAALTAGVLYAVLPMTVYFGRMVDQEAVCLFFMLAATAAWQAAGGQTGGRRNTITLAGWVVAIAGAIIVDWAGMLFAALFCAHALLQRQRGWISRRRLALALAAPTLLVAGVLAHLVYAGLDGRWQDLYAIFHSRTAEVEGQVVRKDWSAAGGPWEYTVENLTWPVLVLACVGLALRVLPGLRPRADREVTSRPQDSLGVITVAGLLWLLVFWRQYERHNYWLFYLGPACAVFAAQTVSELTRPLLRFSKTLSRGLSLALLAAVVGMAMLGTDNYFARTAFPPDTIAAWQQIRLTTAPDDRILLYRSPVLDETRGGYHFRNLVPPHLAYYLDRPFDIERDLEAVPALAVGRAALIIPLKDALDQGPKLARLQESFSSSVTSTEVIFDLRGFSP